MRAVYHHFMCGRYAYFYKLSQVLRLIDSGWTTEQAFDAIFNVAPTMKAPVILIGKDGTPGVTRLTWGLVPSWAEDPSVGAKMFNARSETIREKPAYREAFERRRCVVPISGFYEWETLRELKRKKPWYVAPEDGSIMLLAGVWERWTAGDARLDTFSIVTTEACGRMSEIHERSPVMLRDVEWNTWIRGKPDEAIALCEPREPDDLRFTPVSTRVGNIRNNDPSLVECVEHEAGDQLGLF